MSCSDVTLTTVETGNAIPGYAAVVTVNTDTFNGLDNGEVSLREAVVLSASGATVTFAPALSGQTILLTNGHLLVNKNLSIDASALPSGISLDGNGVSRIFALNSGTTATLNSLTVTNGFSAAGGGIINVGNLTMTRCRVAGNRTSGDGGGIQNSGTLTLNNSTVAGNSAASGGGIGAVSGFQMNNSVVANNTSDNISGTLSGANNLTTGNPLLAPLGNYGGPTQTMPPLPSSPAINAGGTTTLLTDQRGLPRISGGTVDVGAVEVQFLPGINPPTLINPVWSATGGGSAFQFTFSNVPNTDFGVLTGTNVALPLNNWTPIGYAIENPAGSGQYQFTATSATNEPQRFYGVSTPVSLN